MNTETLHSHLLKRAANEPQVCTNCTTRIEPGTIYYREEGHKEHIHSLIARRFCQECYAKYGEKKLLKGTK